MTEINKYLAEEVGVDFVDGIIPRREALRRLILLGLSASSAATLLAACAREAAKRPAATPATKPPSGTPSSTPHDVESISFDGQQGRELKAAWAEASSPKGGVLVIHENRGLNDHTRSVAERFSRDGFSALALDLLSEEGGTESFADTAQATAALGAAPPERFLEDMKSGLSELSRRTSKANLGAIGFCFGGGMVWRLLTSGESNLAAAAPFYGPFPENGDLSKSKAAVIAVYGELDSRVNATRDAAKAALERAGLTHEVATFPGADHAFFNDTGPRYNPEAAKQAYSQVRDWFERYLSK